MALTEAQEKELLENAATSKAAIATLTDENKSIKAQLTEKDAKLAKLEQGQSVTDEDRAISALRSTYPTVPESTLRALPVASREAEAKKLHESLSKVAPATNALDAWNKVGNVMPSLDAETEAEKISRAEAKDKAMKAGDSQGVMKAKSNEITRFVLGAILPRA